MILAVVYCSRFTAMWDHFRLPFTTFWLCTKSNWHRLISLGVWGGCGIFASAIGHTWFHKVFSNNVGWRRMGDAYETARDISDWNRITRTIHTECMAFDFDFTTRRWPIDLPHHHSTIQTHRWQRPTHVCVTTLHVVCLRCIVETRQHTITNCRYFNTSFELLS